MRPEDPIIDKIVNSYLGDVSDARNAFTHDAEYHWQIRFMRQLLGIFNLAMKQVELPYSARYEILERVMMAAPDPNEALKRIEALKTLELKSWPT